MPEYSKGDVFSVDSQSSAKNEEDKPLLLPAPEIQPKSQTTHFADSVASELRSLQNRFLEIASFAAVLRVIRGTLPPWIHKVRLERRGELVHLMLFCDEHPPEIEVQALTGRLRQFINKHPTAIDLVRNGSSPESQLCLLVVPPNESEPDEISRAIKLLELGEPQEEPELPPSSKKKRFNSSAFQLEAKRTAPVGTRLWKSSIYEIPGSKKKGDFIFSTFRMFIPESLNQEVESWRNHLETKYRIGILILRETISDSITKQLQNIADEDGVVRSSQSARELIHRIHGVVPKFNSLLLPHLKFPADARDMTDRPAISIDPVGAMDLDDLIDATLLPSGGYRVWIYFADVTHFVKPGDDFDKYAGKVSFSLYGRTTSVPLLGRELGYRYLSLLPEEERLAWCVRIDINSEGQIVEHDFFRSIVKSHKRYTFDELHPNALKPSGGIPQQLRALYEAAQLLRAKRLERAGFVKFKEEGSSYIVIEELMLASKGVIASIFERAKLPILYRVHTPPGRVLRKEIIAKLRSIGIDATYRDLNDPHRFRVLLGRIQELGAMPMLHFVLDSYLLRARYDVQNRGHHGLGLDAYTEIKALRNYAGLLNQRQAAHLISDEPPVSEYDLRRWQTKINRKHRTFHDNVVRLLTFEALGEKLQDVGKEFDATVIEERPYGTMIRVPSFETWGLIAKKRFWQNTIQEHPTRDESLLDDLQNTTNIRVRFDGYNPEFRRFIFTEI